MSGGDTPSLQLFPIVIGTYEEHPHLVVDPELHVVTELFAEFGAEPVPWAVPMAERGGDAVDRRLREWSRPDTPADSVLYWLGHGWSDGLDVSLAHARSPVAVRLSGLLPAQLAEAVRARHATAAEQWTMVIVDTCWSSRFVDRLNAELASGVLGADRVLLVGVSGDGSTALGRFSDALRRCLTESFRTDERIELWRLAAELDRRLPTGLVAGRRLGEAALVRHISPVAAAVSLPLDLLRELETVLAALSTDERTHFVDKARSAQEGELSWFFEGRATERAQLVRWLRTASSGMLVVTGPAGSGKSALLGHVLVHSLPDLRSVLVRARLVDALTDDQQPADGVFDAAVHLTGMTLGTLVRLVAAAAAFEPGDAEAGPADVLDRLVAHLQRRERPLTLLVDALDEAVEPLAVARTVLRRIASVPTVRLVVGTRASTREGLAKPEPDDQDLLDALIAVTPAGFARVVWLERDTEAARRYVTRRLTLARERGALAVNGRAVAPDQVEAVADLVGGRGHFLYAHLAVHEIIAKPRLLTATGTALADALPGDHRALFAHAVDRLAHRSTAFLPLMDALALGRGRGVPIAGGIWAAMASALAASPVRDADVSAFLEAARPYVVVDQEGGQTVYRLAHRAFAERFLGTDGARSRQSLLARALIALTVRGESPNPYVVRHLSGHVADAGLWPDLAHVPAVLDRLDPLAVTADVLRTVFGSPSIPVPLAGVVHARHRLAAAAVPDRAGIRQIACAHLRERAFTERPGPARPWTLRAAHLQRVSLHVALAGHDGYVSGLAFLDDPRIGRVLASAGNDGTIRLWAPATALPVGAPLVGHSGAVAAVCPVPGPGGRALLVSAGADGTVRVWDPATALAVGPPLHGHTGAVSAVCAVSAGADRTLVASAGGDGTVRLWDVGASSPLGTPLTGHDGAVLAVCAIPSGTDDQLVASAGVDATIRLWNPASAAPAGPPLRGHTGVVSTVCAVPGPDGRTLLASSGDDRTIRLWDTVTGAPAGLPLTGHTAGVAALTVVTGLHGRDLLASVGADGTVRLWDTAAGAAVGAPLGSLAGAMWAVAAVPSSTGAPLLASAGEDGSVRLWDLSAAFDTARPPALTPGLVCAVAVAPRAGGGTDVVSVTMDGQARRWDAATLLPVGTRATLEPGLVVMARVVTVEGRVLLATAEHDGTVRRWRVDTFEPHGSPLRGHEGPALALATVPGPAGTDRLASGGGDGTVRLWDPASDGPAVAVLTGHRSAVRSVCMVDGPDGRQLLASGDMDGTVRLWDPLAYTAVGAPLTGHSGPVLALAAPRLGVLAVGCVNGSVRCWDVATGAPAGPPFPVHPAIIRAMCAVPPWLASAGADGRIRLSDATLSGAGVDLPGHGMTVRDLWPVTGPGRRQLLASGGHDGTVRLWDPDSRALVGAPAGGRPESVDAVATVTGTGGTPVRVVVGEAGMVGLWDPARGRRTTLELGRVVTAVAPGPPGSALAALGAANGWAAVVDVLAGTVVGAPCLTGDSPVVALCLLAVPQPLLVVGTADGRLSIWDTRTGRAVHRIDALHDGPVRAVCASPGGLLVTAGQDGTVRTVDAATGAPVGTALTGHQGWVWSVTLSPGADWAASAGADGTVRLWDMHGGHPHAAVLAGHTDQVRAVRFLTGAALASGGHDGTVRIWDVAAHGPHATLPVGVPVHALDHHDATVTAGTADGVVDLIIDASLLPA